MNDLSWLFNPWTIILIIIVVIAWNIESVNYATKLVSKYLKKRKK